MADKKHCDRCDVVLPHGESDVSQRVIEGDDEKLGAFGIRVFVYLHRGDGVQLDLCAKCHRELRSHCGIK